MKKVITIILSCIFFLFTLCSCAGNQEKDNYKTSFSITVEGADGGTLECDKEKVNIGEYVTFTMTASGENVLETFWVNGGKVTVVESETKGTYVWTMRGIISDVTVKATFVNPNGSVCFDANGGTCDIESQETKLYEIYGELPTPYCVGKRFIGWFDEQNNLVLASSKVTSVNTTLKAKW
ncbi:MAG: InlB B-repeat-containing protein, partial [Clostridia bacterium]|nr:InlB B-repeat-containing protein [Clostridia bacterium]